MADTNLFELLEVHVFHRRNAGGQEVVVAMMRAQQDAGEKVLVESHLNSVGDTDVVKVDVQCRSSAGRKSAVFVD